MYTCYWPKKELKSGWMWSGFLKKSETTLMNKGEKHFSFKWLTAIFVRHPVPVTYPEVPQHLSLCYHTLSLYSNNKGSCLECKATWGISTCENVTLSQFRCFNYQIGTKTTKRIWWMMAMLHKIAPLCAPKVDKTWYGGLMCKKT